MDTIGQTVSNSQIAEKFLDQSWPQFDVTLTATS